MNINDLSDDTPLMMIIGRTYGMIKAKGHIFIHPSHEWMERNMWKGEVMHVMVNGDESK